MTPARTVFVMEDNMETVQAAEQNLVGKLLEFLFKELDEIIREDIADKEKIQREGKVGAKYKFLLEEHPDGRVDVELWPIKGKKNLVYVDRVYGEGQKEDGDAIPHNLGKWSPKVVEFKQLKSTVQNWLDNHDAGLGPIGKHKEDETELISEEDQTTEQVEEEETAAATKVRARLQRVAGSTEITYTAINASCDPEKAMDMLCDAMDCEELANQIGDEPVVVEVIDLGEEGLDANIIDEDVDVSGSPAALEAAKQKLVDAVSEFLAFIDVYSVNFNEEQQNTLAEWSDKLSEQKEMLGEGTLQ